MTEQMGTFTVQKLYVNDRGPCKIVDKQNGEWKFWKPGKFGGIDPTSFQEGCEYTVGYEVKPYDGKDERYIKSIANGQTKPIPKVLQKPVYRQASSPSERKSIETQALAKCLPHWFDKVAPGDSQMLAEMIDKIAKGRDLSVLGGKAEHTDDMDGDVIPF